MLFRQLILFEQKYPMIVEHGDRSILDSTLKLTQVDPYSPVATGAMKEVLGKYVNNESALAGNTLLSTYISDMNISHFSSLLPLSYPAFSFHLLSPPRLLSSFFPCNC